MNVELIPAGADLIEAVALRIEESGGDMAGCLVVFPGKRPGHFLRRRLARSRAAGGGGGFIPPRILSMDELVGLIFDAREAPPEPVLEDIDAVAILHEIQLSTEHPIGVGSFMSLDGFFPLGQKIFRDLEELHLEGIPEKKVREVQPLIQAEVPPRSRERLAELAGFYREFYPEVERRGFSTRSSRYRAAGDLIEPSMMAGFHAIILAGFYALTAAERTLFLRLGSWPHVRFIFQDGPGMREKLDLLGVTPALAEAPAPPSPKVRFSTSPDTHGQVFALSAAVADLDENTAVILPSADTLFPLLRHFLSRFPDESYNVSLGYPLDRTPLYGFFADLMELISSMDGERIYLPDYLTFVLHPYTKNTRFRGSAEATRVLFHALEDKIAASRTRTFATLEELESDEELFTSAAKSIGMETDGPAADELAEHLRSIHRRTIRGFRSFTTVGEFAEKCIHLIDWVHESSTAPDHPFFSQFSEEFIRSLQTISRSLLAEKSFSDTNGYFFLLKRYLRTRYYPFPGTPLCGLQVLGALETRCLRFDRVFVLDANEGTLPPSGGEDSLLPYAVRRSLGLPTYRDRDEAAAYQFEQLARGAGEIHLFSVESGERSRSRFVERLLWERQKAEGAVEETGFVRPIQYRVNLSNRAPEPAAKTGEMVKALRGLKYSASALDVYLRCPLGFYYKHVLNLGRREEVSGGIERTDVGLFVHEALLRYFSPRAGRRLTQADADRRAMEAIVDRLFLERYGSAETGANRLLKDQIRNHLGDFIDDYLRPLLGGHSISLEALESKASASQGGFALGGRMDAIENRDGAAWIIDYKTSANSSRYRIRFDKLNLEDASTWSAAIPTIQLPFYLMLLNKGLDGHGRAPSNAMVLLLGRSALNPGIEVPLYKDEEEARKEQPRLERVIMSLIEEIVSDTVPFAPARDLKRACPYCDFPGLCGTKWLA